MVAAIPSLYNLLIGGKFDVKTLLAFIVPFAEVAWRQLHPALTASAADVAPGVTIVPDQLDSPVADLATDLPLDEIVSKDDPPPN